MLRNFSILLVEDNETDEMIAVRTIKRSGIECEISIARDGVEACEKLFELGIQPSLILLDLHLPKLNGFEVLERLKAEPCTRRIPVVVFSSSDEQRDIDRSFDLHANSYVQKQVDPEIYESSLKVALYYWVAVNRCSDDRFAYAFPR